MPNINEFIGPKPTEKQSSHIEKMVGNKPCAKCDMDSTEYFWDNNNYIMTWTCPNNHHNTVKVNS